MLENKNQLSNFIYPFFKEIENLFEEFGEEITNKSSYHKSFPPTDISIYQEKNSTNISIIEMAIAGFEQKDITMEVNKKIINGQSVNMLTVFGAKNQEFKEKRKKQKEENKYILEGISYKSFKRDFIIFEAIEKIIPEIKNGILTIKIYEKQIESPNIKIEFK